MKENSVRLKIFLVKPENIDATDLIKEPSERSTGAKFIKKQIYDNTLYYKQSYESVPKWYTNFLGQDDREIFSSSVSAFFFYTIKAKGQKVKFAIVFGGGESGLSLEKFDDSFGLRIALNLADSFLNIKKDNISTTLSKTREQAVRGQGVTSFGIDFEKDMLNGVTVKPKENSISVGNITGAMSVSIAKPLEYSELDDLLQECYRISNLSDYQREYPFINNIKEITQDKNLIEELNNEILRLFNLRDSSRVWLSVPEFIDWTENISYTYSWGRSKNAKKTEEFEVTSENAYHFLDEFEDEIKIEQFSDFKKAKIIPLGVSGREYDPWTFEDCLYAHIDFKGNQYVYSNKKYYKVNKDYVETVNKRFNSIGVLPPLPDFTKTSSENQYILDICKDDERLIMMDQKCEFIQTKIEICDIFDKEQKLFIHLKKYASSAVLSHLFSQAFVSADIFADIAYRQIFLNRLKQEDENFIMDEHKENYSVAIGIITQEVLDEGKHANLPFFSRLNLVSTIEKIQKLGYKNVNVMYIHSSAPLYNKKNSE